MKNKWAWSRWDRPSVLICVGASLSLALLAGSGCARVNEPVTPDEIAARNNGYAKPLEIYADDLLADYSYTDGAEVNLTNVIAAYGRAIQANSNNASAYQARGAAEGAMGDFAACIADCSTAIELSTMSANTYQARGSAIAYLTRGFAYGCQGNFEAASADFGKAVELAPRSAAAQYALGLAIQARGEPRAAIGDYNLAIDFKKNYENAHYADALYARALAEESIKDYEKAIKDYDKAIVNTYAFKITPPKILLPTPLIWLGWLPGLPIVPSEGKFLTLPLYLVSFPKDVAVPLPSPLPDFLVLNQNDLGALNNRGVAKVELAKSLTRQNKKGEDIRDDHCIDLLESAIVDFSRAIRINRNFEKAWNNRGYAKQLRGKLGEADADFTIAAGLRSQLSRASNNLARLRLAKGDMDGSAAHPIADIDLMEYDPQHLLKRAVDKKNKGDFAGAIHDCTKAIALELDFWEAYQIRGDAEQAQGDLTAAAADHKKGAELKEKRVMVYLERGKAKQEAGDPHGATNEYNAALEVSPHDARAFNGRGLANYDMTNLDAAIADFNSALKFSPSNGVYYFNRGFARQSRGELTSAAADYDKAIELGNKAIEQSQVTVRPSDFFARAYYYLGTIEQTNGDWHGAISNYTKVIELKPDDVVGRGMPYGHTLYSLAYQSRGDVEALQVAVTGDRTMSTNAIKDYTKVIELVSHPVHAYKKRGDQEGIYGDDVSALHDYGAATRSARSITYMDLFIRNYDYQKTLQMLDEALDRFDLTDLDSDSRSRDLTLVVALVDGLDLTHKQLKPPPQNPWDQNRLELTDLETDVNGQFYTLLARTSLIDWKMHRVLGVWARN